MVKKLLIMKDNSINHCYQDGNKKWLVFKLGLVIVSDTYNVSKGQYDAFFKLRKKVLTRLDQIDSNIIDTTLDERLKIAEWFAQEKDLVGIKKDKNSSIEYTLFYSNNNSLSEIIKLKYSIPITVEIDKQMIDGYIYSISDLLTYNAPCRVEK